MWTKDQANQWQAKQPYYVGSNFTPSTAINQLEMWQAETFDPQTIRRELSFAAGVGMNVMRVYLHDLLWDHDQRGFIQRIGQYLDVAHSLHIKTLFVLFDDCWRQTFSLGKQPDPQPYTHNSGWIQSPGVRIVNDPAQWSRIQRYTIELLSTFKDDPRIMGWDLYNEPGNGTSGDSSGGQTKQIDRSLPLLKAVFDWARSVSGLTQPLTCAIWNTSPEFKNLNEFSLNSSDIISFHNYGPPQALAEMIRNLAQHGRPMLCSEYMARGAGSTFEFCLPILKKYNVGAINWGLVAGKTQTIYPWGWNATKGEPDILFHDIFRPDGSFLYPREESAIKQITMPRDHAASNGPK